MLLPGTASSWATVEKLALRVVDSRKLLASLADSRTQEAAGCRASSTNCVSNSNHGPVTSTRIRGSATADAFACDRRTCGIWPTPF
jgi:hypothetical protein